MPSGCPQHWAAQRNGGQGCSRPGGAPALLEFERMLAKPKQPLPRNLLIATLLEFCQSVGMRLRVHNNVCGVACMALWRMLTHHRDRIGDSLFELPCI